MVCLKAWRLSVAGFRNSCRKRQLRKPNFRPRCRWVENRPRCRLRVKSSSATSDRTRPSSSGAVCCNNSFGRLRDCPGRMLCPSLANAFFSVRRCCSDWHQRCSRARAAQRRTVILSAVRCSRSRTGSRPSRQYAASSAGRPACASTSRCRVTRRTNSSESLVSTAVVCSSSGASNADLFSSAGSSASVAARTLASASFRPSLVNSVRQRSSGACTSAWATA